MISILLVYTVLILGLTNCADQSLQCGDWDSFRDELCFKVFTNKELQSYSDARNMCYQNEGSSLVSIGSQEEQTFLFNLLHDVHKTLNDVWIGAEYKENKLKWLSNMTVNYTNLANGYPVNESEYECVNMVMEEPLHGKWHNAICNKNNVVMCENPQNWLFSYLQNTVMEMRKSIDSLTLQLESTKTQLLNTESKLQAQITESSNTKIDLNNTKTLLENNKIEFEQTKSNLQTEIIKSAAQSTPPGTIAYFAHITAPLGWLKANGQSVSRTTYANLFASIGTTFGSGDGSTTFTLPDLRGEFIRSWSDNKVVDKNRSFGTFQWGSSIPFASYIDGNSGVASGPGQYANRDFAATTFDSGLIVEMPSGNSSNGLNFPTTNKLSYVDVTKVGTVTKWSALSGTRPRNIALLACIKH